MLWRKAWMETRWRFLIGLGLLMCSAAATVIAYPQVMRLMTLVPDVDPGGEIGRKVRESAELARTFRGYVWSQWFVQNLSQLWTLFAILLGTGGLLSSSSGTLFTLSLPVSRRRLLEVRAATGLGESLVLAVVPSLIIPILSPAVGAGYPVGDALVHGASLFIAGSVFFSLAFLLSTVFNDLWRPLLLALCVAVGLGLLEHALPGGSRFGVFRVMSAEGYFRGHGLPWPGLLAAVAVSAALMYAAVINVARRDF